MLNIYSEERVAKSISVAASDKPHVEMYLNMWLVVYLLS